LKTALTLQGKQRTVSPNIKYIRVIKGGKNRENGRYILNANNKTKSVANNKQRIWENPSI
jgi:arginine repressor